MQSTFPRRSPMIKFMLIYGGDKENPKHRTHRLLKWKETVFLRQKYQNLANMHYFALFIKSYLERGIASKILILFV